MFEKSKQRKYAKPIKPSKTTMEFMDRHLMEAKEPYDEQWEVGKHPKHDQDLLKAVPKFRANQEVEAAMKAKKGKQAQRRKSQGSSPRTKKD